MINMFLLPDYEHIESMQKIYPDVDIFICPNCHAPCFDVRHTSHDQCLSFLGRVLESGDFALNPHQVAFFEKYTKGAK